MPLSDLKTNPTDRFEATFDVGSCGKTLLMNALSPLKLVPETDALVAREYPQVIKYMGSKAKIIDFVVEGINRARANGPICDLFAGACSLSGAVGHLAPIVTNDIQAYSRVIAHTYLHPLSKRALAISPDAIVARASAEVLNRSGYTKDSSKYESSLSLKEFNQLEIASRQLLAENFNDSYHLFLKNYSGTWWSSLQCAWIDALRQTIDAMLQQGEIDKGDHAIYLTAVMHAMAYCGQGTGHYAQYRDAKTLSSMNDICIYRQKSIASYFERKLRSLVKWNLENVSPNHTHTYSSEDYTDCLKQIPPSTVYADPPYAFVHYSRFYHAIETFTLYDYPNLQIKGGEVVKGRYREDRHQSPFSIRSQVEHAFSALFDGVADSESNLVLSYSNTALLDLNSLVDLAFESFDSRYKIEALTMDHQHMTMGRRADRTRNVEEAILLVRRH